jgi:hypothetical protein
MTKKRIMKAMILILLTLIPLYYQILQPTLIPNIIVSLRNMFIEQITFDPGEEGNTKGNILNDAFVTKSGDSYLFNKNPFSIYRASADLKDEIALYSKTSGYTARSINAVGDWVFFASNGIYRMTYEGKFLARLHLGVTSNLQVIGNWIYFIQNDGKDYVYRISVNGAQRELVYGSRTYVFVIMDNKLFSIGSTPPPPEKLSHSDPLRLELKVIDLKSNEDLLAEVEVFTPQFVVDEGWIYFINRDDGNRLYKITHNGDHLERLTDKTIKGLNIEGSFLYFINHSDEGVYRIDKNGNDLIKLTDTSLRRINILDGWIMGITQKDDGNTYLVRVKTDGTVEGIVSQLYGFFDLAYQ